MSDVGGMGQGSRERRPESGQPDDLLVPDADAATTSPRAMLEGVDELLDEIDGVLEENAEEFVRGYVQKGGQ
jgi:prokaryotic ubiquitin-like protein Pup